MWSDLEMLIMCLCCIGLGFSIGDDWGEHKQIKRRSKWPHKRS